MPEGQETPWYTGKGFYFAAPATLLCVAAHQHWLSFWGGCLLGFILYFGLVSWAMVREAPAKSLGTWVYDHRWGKVFWAWVVPGIVSQVLLVAWTFHYFHTYFMGTGQNPRLVFPAFAGTVPLWPLFLLLWFVRDRNKEAEMKQDRINQLQDDFHKLQEWVTDPARPDNITLKVSAVHQLKRYLSGEAIDDKKPVENAFQLPTLEIFMAILQERKPYASNESDDSKSDQGINPGPVSVAIATVFRTAFCGKFPTDVLAKNLSGIVLPTSDLEEVNFKRANLSGAHLNRAKLSGAKLSGAKLNGADLSGADLFGADLINADLNKAILNEAKLSGAKLSGAKLSEAYLRGAYLRGAYLSEADLSEADLFGADLSGADLFGADLINADLNKAILNEAKLSGAKLSGAKLSEACLRGAYLSEADLSEADLSGADLSGADLFGADLFGAGLINADLNKAILNEAKLSGAKLSEADLIGAILNRANLIGANLRGANLRGAKLIGANLRGAKLNGADLQHCILSPRSYSYAKESGGILEPEEESRKRYKDFIATQGDGAE